MAKFMLLLHDDPKTFVGKPQTEIMEIVKEFLAWTQKMRAESRLVGGEKLKLEPGRVMHKKGGKVVVEDGPGIIGGTMIIEAKDYGEACRLAETCPELKYNGTIEVREIDQI